MRIKASPRQQGIQSIEVGNRLLGALIATSHPLTLKDLARAARMSAPKAHRYLVSFSRTGLVDQDPVTGRYDLGATALKLGLAALGRLDAVSLATPAIQRLAEEIGQTVAIAIWANHGPTIVRWVGSDSPVSATLRVGSVMPLTRSATGRLFLAYLPSARWSRLLSAELAENERQRWQPRTHAEIEGALQVIRRDGYSQTSGFIVGITGVATPVLNHDGSLALALVALGYSEGFDADAARIRQALLRAASDLTQRIGGRP